MKAVRNSFTLVEMLVVIAIIAVLSSMLLPALGKAREYSKSLACKNNLRQLGVALANYEADYNVLPCVIGPMEQISGAWTSTQAANNTFWTGKLMNTGNIQVTKYTYWGATAVNCAILRCPSDTQKLAENYGMNSWLAMRLGIAPTTNYYSYKGTFVDRLKISKVSERALLGESTTLESVDFNPISWDSSNRWPHALGMNLLYLDYHVDHMTRTQMGASADVYRPLFGVWE